MLNNDTPIQDNKFHYMQGKHVERMKRDNVYIAIGVSL